MPTLDTPFWILTDLRATAASPIKPTFAPRHVAAFTGIDKARAFLNANNLDAEVGVVTERTVRAVSDVFRLLGLEGYCVDPVDDGPCSALVRFEKVARRKSLAEN
jgi:hypothetical protein